MTSKDVDKFSEKNDDISSGVEHNGTESNTFLEQLDTRDEESEAHTKKKWRAPTGNAKKDHIAR